MLDYWTQNGVNYATFHETEHGLCIFVTQKKRVSNWRRWCLPVTVRIQNFVNYLRYKKKSCFPVFTFLRHFNLLSYPLLGSLSKWTKPLLVLSRVPQFVPCVRFCFIKGRTGLNFRCSKLISHLHVVYIRFYKHQRTKSVPYVFATEQRFSVLFGNLIDKPSILCLYQISYL